MSERTWTMPLRSWRRAANSPVLQRNAAGTGFAMQARHPTKERTMAEAGKELVVVITHGIDHEVSSVGFTIANGGITAGLKVAIFLTSAAVDIVRKKAA